ncbi:unnamed protein product [Pleuronectes platessa]|uniref:Uncharacterized protein n=1 Tax=Pleuronectes platessa TaxID=8262 RepID=A0A9N7V310_PLEPL|nr:unnamed protein product [Pleuronectes platessa]
MLPKDNLKGRRASETKNATIGPPKVSPWPPKIVPSLPQTQHSYWAGVHSRGLCTMGSGEGATTTCTQQEQATRPQHALGLLVLGGQAEEVSIPKHKKRGHCRNAQAARPRIS